MGIWGAAPFDNDDALDLLADLDEGRDEDLIGGLRDALAQVEPGGTLEAPEVSEAVAAACLVAAQLEAGPRPEEPTAAAWLEAHPFEVDASLRVSAAAALDRALLPGDNEWYELWEDADALDEVNAALAPYRAALRS
ncbi:MAG: DUF4259 domain-containing protein [Nitriliruptor sp.]